MYIIHMDVNERFWKKVKKTSTCWIWTGALMSKGYGSFAFGGPSKTVLAHRFAWKLLRGEHTPKTILCHTCDNPKCVNPDHLYEGDYSTNAVDREKRGRGTGAVALNRNKTHCSNGHAFSKSNTARTIDKYGHEHRRCRKCCVIWQSESRKRKRLRDALSKS